MFDIYTIIFLALAVFIVLRLRSVLGQRTGRERPPYDPYSARDAVREMRLPGPQAGETIETRVHTIGEEIMRSAFMQESSMAGKSN